jgi:hypothetical protein
MTKVRVVLPRQDVEIDTPTGVDPVWYEKFQQLTSFVNLFSEINFATMPDTQILIWDATAKKFKAGPH